MKAGILSRVKHLERKAGSISRVPIVVYSWENDFQYFGKCYERAQLENIANKFHTDILFVDCEEDSSSGGVCVKSNPNEDIPRERGQMTDNEPYKYHGGAN